MATSPDPAGAAAVGQWRARREECGRPTLARAVRHTLSHLARTHPGRSVEVRVPPFAAVQILPGATHRRGTPPAVVEMDPTTWLSLAVGDLTWEEACARGRVSASGQRADLSALLPLFDVSGECAACDSEVSPGAVASTTQRRDLGRSVR